MLWIALNLPQLPLDIVLRTQFPDVLQTARKTPTPPLAVLHKKSVGWCNAAASKTGVSCGMSEIQAWSRCADLQLHHRDILQEHRVLEEAALWALHFTPHVTLRLPSPKTLQNCGLLAEVAPSLNLFNGLSPLLIRMAQGIADLGLHASWASAPTASGAWLLAQHAPLWFLPITLMTASKTASKSFVAQKHLAQCSISETSQLLDALPLQVLDQIVDLKAEYLATLQEIGCSTLGHLRRFPRGGITRRFGNGLLTELDRAYGAKPEVHDWFNPPATVDLELVLPAAVENTQALLFASRRLVMQLTGWLTARHCAVADMTLWLHHEPKRRRDQEKKYSGLANSTTVTIILTTPSRDPEHLELLLRERLAHVKLPAPVIEIALIADQVIAQSGLNTELFPTASSDINTLSRLLEKLQSRLGMQAVSRLTTQADHRPERSHAHIGLLQNKISAHCVLGNSAKNKMLLPGATMRPSWLLAEPLPLSTRQHKPFYQGPLTLLVGPERIESGWWDDALALRDYFIAQNDRHMLLWIFRLRPDGQKLEENWFLHGFFA
jgi:protein ImuB